MPKIAIVTDSNSGILQLDAQKLGIYVVPMPFTINKKDYEEGVDLTQDMFFDLLEQGANVSTSQPSIGKLANLFDELLEQYDFHPNKSHQDMFPAHPNRQNFHLNSILQILSKLLQYQQ